jgi:predicted RNA-binding protein with PUA-like domain
VDLAPVRAFPKSVTLAQIKVTPALKDIALLRQSRLSVLPLTPAEYALILSLGGIH